MGAPTVSSTTSNAQSDTASPFLYSIAQGLLWAKFQESGKTSFAFEAILCPVRHAFIEKGKVGSHYRAISRNGVVLLMSRTALGELSKVRARVRISIWHRSHLRGERATAWGILLCLGVHGEAGRDDAQGDGLVAVIGRERIPDATLSFEIGGERILNFVR